METASLQAARTRFGEKLEGISCLWDTQLQAPPKRSTSSKRSHFRTRIKSVEKLMMMCTLSWSQDDETCVSRTALLLEFCLVLVLVTYAHSSANVQSTSTVPGTSRLCHTVCSTTPTS